MISRLLAASLVIAVLIPGCGETPPPVTPTPPSADPAKPAANAKGPKVAPLENTAQKPL
jgi:hypothetical protein